MSEGVSFSGREMNCCFLNTHQTRFADISTASGLAYPDDGRAIGVVDWDRDGRVDLWLANRTGPQLRLMRNHSAPTAHWIGIRLRGTTCNRDAIGARVEVHREGYPPLMRTLRAGENFLSQSSKWLTFGLGSSEAVDKVIVKWPGGESQTFRLQMVDRRYELTEGPGGSAVASTVPAVSSPLVAHRLPTSPPETGAAQLRLAGPIPMPTLHYRDTHGDATPLLNQQWTLVNLWSQTCRPCLAELKEFADHREAIQDRSLHVIGLNVDDQENAKSAQAVLERFDWPFVSGRADPQLLDGLDILQRVCVAQRHQMPIPTSFLIDNQNRLCAIYKGQVAVDRLLEDLERLQSEDEEPWEFGVPMPGKWSRTPVTAGSTFMELVFEYLNAGYLETAAELLPRLRVVADQTNSQAVVNSLSTAYLNLAAQYADAGRNREAIANFEEVLRIDPEHARAHLALALLLKKQGKQSELFRHLRAAVKSDPTLDSAQLELGLAYAGLGQAQSALRHLELAHRARPDSIAPLNVMARILALHPDPAIKDLPRATSLARQAVKISEQEDAQSLDTLAHVYLAGGKPSEAKSTWEKALQVAKSHRQQRLTQAIQARLASLAAAAGQE